MKSIMLYSPVFVVLLWGGWVDLVGKPESSQVLWVVVFIVSIWAHLREERHHV